MPPCNEPTERRRAPTATPHARAGVRKAQRASMPLALASASHGLFRDCGAPPSYLDRFPPNLRETDSGVGPRSDADLKMYLAIIVPRSTRSPPGPWDSAQSQFGASHICGPAASFRGSLPKRALHVWFSEPNAARPVSGRSFALKRPMPFVPLVRPRAYDLRVMRTRQTSMQAYRQILAIRPDRETRARCAG